MGAGIWIVVTAIATYAIGGYIAVRLPGKPLRSTAGYHGLATFDRLQTFARTSPVSRTIMTIAAIGIGVQASRRTMR